MAELEISTRKWDFKFYILITISVIPSEHWGGWRGRVDLIEFFAGMGNQHLWEPEADIWSPQFPGGGKSIPTRICLWHLQYQGICLCPQSYPSLWRNPTELQAQEISPHYPPASGPLEASVWHFLSHQFSLRWTPSGRALPCYVWTCRKTDGCAKSFYAVPGWGIPWRSPVRTLSCQCRRPGFIPWLGELHPTSFIVW